LGIFVVTMYGQTAAGWKALKGLDVDKRIMLNADTDTLDMLRSSNNLKLRVICNQGSSFMFHLSKRDSEEPPGDGSHTLVTIQVSKERLLECLGGKLEVYFWNNETCQGEVFRVDGVTQDKWLSGWKPLCEPMQ
jgi:hypothetical protein